VTAAVRNGLAKRDCGLTSSQFVPSDQRVSLTLVIAWVLYLVLLLSIEGAGPTRTRALMYVGSW
jgi:hypothetical protein